MIMIMSKYLPLFALMIPLSACSTVELNPAAKHIEITPVAAKLLHCDYVGEVIGTAGHWYDFIYLSNNDLMQWALNDMRNQAMDKGADTLYIEEPQSFTTSVTLLGIAYRCHK
jgi:hypothetical protein